MLWHLIVKGLSHVDVHEGHLCYLPVLISSNKYGNGWQAKFAVQMVSVLQEAIEDTTGAGDAFIGTVLYAVTQGMPHDKMLKLAAVVAACKCTALGARPGLPYAQDISPQLLKAWHPVCVVHSLAQCDCGCL